MFAISSWPAVVGQEQTVAASKSGRSTFELTGLRMRAPYRVRLNEGLGRYARRLGCASTAFPSNDDGTTCVIEPLQHGANLSGLNTPCPYPAFVHEGGEL